MSYEFSDEERIARQREKQRYWISIYDKPSAAKAARRSQWVAGYLIVSYCIQISIIIFSGSDTVGRAYASGAETIGAVGFSAIVAGLLVGAIFRIRKDKFGTVPWIVAVFFVEALGTVLNIISVGTVVIIFIAVHAANALIGWYRHRKYPDIDEVSEVFS